MEGLSTILLLLMICSFQKLIALLMAREMLMDLSMEALKLTTLVTNTKLFLLGQIWKLKFCRHSRRNCLKCFFLVSFPVKKMDVLYMILRVEDFPWSAHRRNQMMLFPQLVSVSFIVLVFWS